MYIQFSFNMRKYLVACIQWNSAQGKIKKMETLYFYSSITLLHVLLSNVTLGPEIPHDLLRSFGANYSSFVNFIVKSSALELTSEPRLV